MKRNRCFPKIAASTLLTVGCLLLPVVAAHAQSETQTVIAVPAQPSEPGVLITSATVEGPAAKAGLRRGDIVLAVDGNAVNNAAELRTAISSHKAGEEVTLSVLHGDEKREIKVTLAPRDDSGVLGVVAHADAPMQVIGDVEVTHAPMMGVPEILPLPSQIGDTTGSFSQTVQIQIVEVSADSPAEQAGLLQGERITEIDGEAISSPNALADRVHQSKPGDKLSLTVVGQSGTEESRQVEVTLGESKEQSGQAYLGIRMAPMITIQSEVGGMAPAAGGMMWEQAAPAAPPPPGSTDIIIEHNGMTGAFAAPMMPMMCMPLAGANMVMGAGQPPNVLQFRSVDGFGSAAPSDNFIPNPQMEHDVQIQGSSVGQPQQDNSFYFFQHDDEI